ncbi:MAG: glycosyltransferase, partial [Candidatus Bipolaricaulota bacterium]|nr:glycosyltransferase [Candidatus Bipolaricaulota bacterium]
MTKLDAGQVSNRPASPILFALIPAHNEAATIGAALNSLRSATPPPNHIFVIADHCTDVTAAIARNAGAL